MCNIPILHTTTPHGSMYMSARHAHAVKLTEIPPHVPRTHKAVNREVKTIDGYTEYGYTLNGAEYATIDEAYEAQANDSE